jgi:hypothetical protein
MASPPGSTLKIEILIRRSGYLDVLGGSGSALSIFDGFLLETMGV